MMRDETPYYVVDRIYPDVSTLHALITEAVFLAVTLTGLLLPLGHLHVP